MTVSSSDVMLVFKSRGFYRTLW